MRSLSRKFLCGTPSNTEDHQMGVQFVIDTPSEIRYFDPAAPQLDATSAQQVAEIFQTPLTGAYNWDYKIQDDRIKSWRSPD